MCEVIEYTGYTVLWNGLNILYLHCRTMLVSYNILYFIIIDMLIIYLDFCPLAAGQLIHLGTRRALVVFWLDLVTPIRS